MSFKVVSQLTILYSERLGLPLIVQLARMCTVTALLASVIRRPHMTIHIAYDTVMCCTVNEPLYDPSVTLG